MNDRVATRESPSVLLKVTDFSLLIVLIALYLDVDANVDYLGLTSKMRGDVHN
jgi:hypothetical protein